MWGLDAKCRSRRGSWGHGIFLALCQWPSGCGKHARTDLLSDSMYCLKHARLAQRDADPGGDSGQDEPEQAGPLAPPAMRAHRRGDAVLGPDGLATFTDHSVTTLRLEGMTLQCPHCGSWNFPERPLVTRRASCCAVMEARPPTCPPCRMHRSLSDRSYLVKIARVVNSAAAFGATTLPCPSYPSEPAWRRWRARQATQLHPCALYTAQSIIIPTPCKLTHPHRRSMPNSISSIRRRPRTCAQSATVPCSRTSWRRPSACWKLWAIRIYMPTAACAN